MIDYRDDMDRNWMMRLENQRLDDARMRRENDRRERTVLALVVVLALLVVVGLMAAMYAFRGQASTLTIIVPDSTPTPTPEETAEPTLFGTVPDALEARMLQATEPPKLRTAPNHPPSARPVEPGPRFYRRSE